MDRNEETPGAEQAQSTGVEYDPEFSRLGIDGEHFADLDPHYQRALTQLRDERADAQRQAQMLSEAHTTMSAQMARLGERLSTVESGAQEAPQSEIQRASADDLHAAISNYDQLQVRAASGDDEAKAQLANFGPSIRADMMDELISRRAQEAITPIVEQVEGRFAQSERQSRFSNELLQKFGADALHEQSPLRQIADPIAQKIISERGLQTEQEKFMALEMALSQAQAQHVKDNRAGDAHRPAAEHRQRAVEGAGSRSAEFQSTVAALRSKGDWKGRKEAGRMEVKSLLGRLAANRASATRRE